MGIRRTIPGMTVTLHLTGKNFLTVIAGVCIVFLAVIPLAVPVDHLGCVRWQIAVIALAAIAVVALLWQAFLQSQEDRKRDEREQARDGLLANIQSQVER
jgi:membrane protein implicated in regulation of membrane protease activity